VTAARNVSATFSLDVPTRFSLRDLPKSAEEYFSYSALFA
jgi:hypothetical protein